MVKSQPFLRYILRGIPAIAVAVLLSACSTSNPAKNMHPETRVVGMDQRTDAILTDGEGHRTEGVMQVIKDNNLQLELC